MTVVERLENLLLDLKSQQKLGRDINWPEVLEIGKRVSDLGTDIENLAWDKIEGLEEAA